MNRSDLQRLARIRAREAKGLLNLKEPNGAYYLAGYSVECALKACLAKQTRRYDFPDRRNVLQSHTHNLHDLLHHAGLEAAMLMDSAGVIALADNWIKVKEWSELSRYQEKTQSEAEQLVRAVLGRNGVLPWLMRRW
jgi:HEPN domain-containing protein